MSNNHMKFRSWILLGIFLGALFLVLPQHVQAASENRIAYIYGNNLTFALSYESYLETQGYIVDVIHMNDINSTAFADYKLTIIGPSTSPMGSGSLWGSNTTAIMASGTPILGIWAGGGHFLDAIGGPGWSLSAYAAISNMTIENTTHPIFTSPHSIPATPDTQISLTVSSALIFNNASLMSNQVLLASFPANPAYYPLYTWQNGTTKVVQFGFNTHPTGMTQTGKNLLLNIVHFLAPSPTDQPIPGFPLLYLCLSFLLLLLVLRRSFQVPPSNRS